MQETGVLEPAERQELGGDLRLLVPRDSWAENFLQNFREQFRAAEPVAGDGDAGEFWADVFVRRELPWARFLQSAVYHALAIGLIWAGSRFLALQPQSTPRPAFTHADVIFYAPSEYLPPLDTRQPALPKRQKSDPEYAAQPIISLPPEAENRAQTIVTPPQLRLRENVPLPNVVSWNDRAALPIAPAPLVPASERTRLAPQMTQAIVAPAPDIAAEKNLRETMRTPQAAVIAPPPEMNVASASRAGDINIGPSSVIAPAPTLALDAQRAGSNQGRANARAVQVVAPPPSMGASVSRSGNLIALNLHPAVAPPPAPPEGNRRGRFAAEPEAKRSGSGAPGNGSGSKDGAATASLSHSNLPSGLYVGKSAEPTASGAANDHQVNPNLLASAKPPRIAAHMHSESESKLADEERAVFGNRKFYSLSLNMPNLNSAGGSWVIRFAALNKDGADSGTIRSSASGANNAGEGSVSAPSATRKVDPAYPLELMRQNIGGTVILYAVIHRDGTIGEVRVLRSVDDRLDRFAAQALGMWQFDPAMKNGVPVEVEATFWIPFKPTRAGSGF